MKRRFGKENESEKRMIFFGRMEDNSIFAIPKREKGV